jgi:putative ABC transport system permease protein
MGVPLAWKNLTHDRLRFGLFSAGIGFAVVLMFVQFGCRNALLDSNVLLIDHFRADLVLVSRKQTTLALRQAFSRHRLAQAAAVPGVRSVHPLYLEYYLSILRNTNAEETKRAPGQAIRVIGVDPGAYLLDLPELDPQRPGSLVEGLKTVGQALFDRRAKRAPGRGGEFVYGPVAPGTETDLAGRRARIVGTFELGGDFGAEGTLIVSVDTFGQWFRPSRTGGGLEEVEIGLVRLEPGVDRTAVLRQLRSLLREGDVDVLTREEMADREKQFWLSSTPIGFVFSFGMLMGFVVGMVICYQVLSSDVADHLAEYATLKAIGYPNRYLTRVVLSEALVLAGAGFVPGLLLSALLYRGLSALTGLPMRLTPGRVGLILALTVLMCAGSGLLALRKAQEVDPAEVF